MIKTYLMAFEAAFASRQEVIDFLDTVPEIPFWYACLPSCVFFTSTLDAGTLAKRLESRFQIGSGQKFIVMEVGTDRQGRLPSQAWHMLRYPDNPREPKKNA